MSSQAVCTQKTTKKCTILRTRGRSTSENYEVAEASEQKESTHLTWVLCFFEVMSFLNVVSTESRKEHRSLLCACLHPTAQVCPSASVWELARARPGRSRATAPAKKQKQKQEAGFRHHQAPQSHNCPSRDDASYWCHGCWCDR